MVSSHSSRRCQSDPAAFNNIAGTYKRRQRRFEPGDAQPAKGVAVGAEIKRGPG
jgi:hypothetical protein